MHFIICCCFLLEPSLLLFVSQFHARIAHSKVAAGMTATAVWLCTMGRRAADGSHTVRAKDRPTRAQEEPLETRRRRRRLCSERFSSALHEQYVEAMLQECSLPGYKKLACAANDPNRILGLALVSLPTVYTGPLSTPTVEHRAALDLWSASSSLCFVEVVDVVAIDPVGELPHAIPRDGSGYCSKSAVFNVAGHHELLQRPCHRFCQDGRTCPNHGMNVVDTQCFQFMPRRNVRFVDVCQRTHMHTHTHICARTAVSAGMSFEQVAAAWVRDKGSTEEHPATAVVAPAFLLQLILRHHWFTLSFPYARFLQALPLGANLGKNVGVPVQVEEALPWGQCLEKAGEEFDAIADSLRQWAPNILAAASDQDRPEEQMKVERALAFLDRMALCVSQSAFAAKLTDQKDWRGKDKVRYQSLAIINVVLATSLIRSSWDFRESLCRSVSVLFPAVVAHELNRHIASAHVPSAPTISRFRLLACACVWLFLRFIHVCTCQSSSIVFCFLRRQVFLRLDFHGVDQVASPLQGRRRAVFEGRLHPQMWSRMVHCAGGHCLQ